MNTTPMLIAIFGIDGGILSLVINLLVLFLVVTYLALIYWTYLDAKRRIEDPVLIACATAASVFPFIGTIVYTILRPPEFLEDREERELELRAAELRLRELIERSCPHCEYPVESSYLRCPNCDRKLRSPCRKCSKPLDPKWGTCPYCETEVRRQRGDRSAAGPSRRTERSTQRPDRSSRPSRPPSGGRPPSQGGGGGGQRPDGQRSGAQRSGGQRPAVGSQRSQSRPQRSTGGASGSFPGQDR
jgi:hypothetical protein